MRRTGSAVSSARRVPTDHLPCAPASEPHQVLFLPTCGEPAVSHRVAEAVRVEMINTGVLAASLQQLRDPGDGERSFAAQPECLRIGR
jgi:hypothetical protein